MTPLVFFLIIVSVGAGAASIKIVGEKERGVVLRLGRIARISGPGLVCVVPGIDRLQRIDLNRNIPGWESLSRPELEARVRHFFESGA